MSNESSPVGGTHGFDSDALEEWVAETADQKGVSKQQLLDEILSSYWVLEELSGVVTDSEVTTESQQSEGQPAVESPGDQRSETTRSASSSTAEFSELKSELQGLRTAIEELSQDRDESQDDTPSETGFSSLEGQLDTLSSAVVERQTETDNNIETLSEQVDALSERVATIESQLNDGMSLSELESAVGQTVSAQTELENRLESEFDSIEQVLQHLLDTTDNIEYRLGAVSESRQEALKPLREQYTIQQELTELKQEALRHDVTTGVCDTCDRKIDLGLLATSACPGCKRRFTGIEKGGWLPFSKATLQTTDQPRKSAPQQQSSNVDDSAGGPTAGGHDSYQTDW